MRRRNWKRLQPVNIRQALELCKVHARERHNLSVERIAAQMGLPDHFALYKWIQTGRFPAVMIPVYERVCGINLVSRWLAASSGKLLVDMPTGRGCSADDMQQLQEALHAATGALLAFYAGQQEASATLGAIQSAMEGLAWHRGNVQQHEQPQLELGEEE